MKASAAQLGLVGLAVMGRNLALNLADHGYRVAVYDRCQRPVDDFLSHPDTPPEVQGHHGLGDFVAGLKSPRCILLLVRAGIATDAVIEELSPLLDDGDLLIDCGNSHYEDTERRGRWLAARGRLFIGAGVSGGEEGARHGPSIMPGGAPEAWPLVRDVLRSIAVEVDGKPCCDWLGAGGAGHYVKMVHNGIEYGDMQLIAEAYDLLYRGLDVPHDQMATIFRRWNNGRLDSYLIEITAAIMSYRTAEGSPLLESILDAAGQKGTGKWTGIDSLDRGIPGSLIAESVYARCLSALVDLRTSAASRLNGPTGTLKVDPEIFIVQLEEALFASKIISYTQGFMLLRDASAQRGWALDLGTVAALWRGGCIIRSGFLNDITAAFGRQPDLECLALDDFFAAALNEAQTAWRQVVCAATLAGIAVPGLGSALSFYDGLRSKRTPANLLQAQRDYFGGHTYELIDRPRGQFFHTDWTGRGGPVSSTVYTV